MTISGDVDISGVLINVFTILLKPLIDVLSSTQPKVSQCDVFYMTVRIWNTM